MIQDRLFVLVVRALHVRCGQQAILINGKYVIKNPFLKQDEIESKLKYPMICTLSMPAPFFVQALMLANSSKSCPSHSFDPPLYYTS